MANTTNFGWETPDDTDLVKDGAAAIRTLGSAIDTSLVDLKGGTTGQVLAKASNTDMDFTWATDASGIPATIFDAKGDIIAASAADTAARLAVGTNGQVLTADSSTATGLKWASPSAADNWTLLNAGGTALTGAATITVSGISGQNKIMVVMDRASTANGSGSDFGVRVNGLTTNVYYGVGSVNYADSPYAFQMFQEWDFGNTTSRLPLAKTIDSASTASGSVTIQGCNSSGVKQFISVGAANYGSSSGHYRYSLQGYIDTSSTISSVSVFSVSGNFDAGTLYVYATA